MNELVTEQEILLLLDELKSDESYRRTRAIRKIKDRVISDKRIIDVLGKVAVQDQSKYVRHDAKITLLAFGVEYSYPEMDIEPVLGKQATGDEENILRDASSRNINQRDQKGKGNKIIAFFVLGLVLNFVVYCINFDKDPVNIVLSVLSLNVIMLLIFIATGVFTK